MTARSLRRPALVSIAALFAATSVIACGDDSGPAPFGTNGQRGPNGEIVGGDKPGSGPITIGPDGMPVGADGQPVPPKLDGQYELSTHIDLTTAGLLPETVNDTLKALSNFREKPTQTMVDLADVANVPFVSLINSVPELIRGFVFGYIDEAVFGALYEKVPVTQKITGMLDDLASSVTNFEVITMLDVPQANMSGDIKAHHTITGVGYHWDEKAHVINAPELVSTLVQQDVRGNSVLLATRTPELETGRLQLNDHTFSVPIGSFAVYATDELAKDKFGTPDGLRGAFGKLIDCEKIAENVSKRCIDPPGPGMVCVDHKAEIKGVCTIGLDLLVGALKGALKNLDIPVLNFKDGVAQMWDAPAMGGPLDATIDRLDKGFWSAAIKVGSEDRPVVASFVGKRIGDTKIAPGPSR